MGTVVLEVLEVMEVMVVTDPPDCEQHQHANCHFLSPPGFYSGLTHTREGRVRPEYFQQNILTVLQIIINFLM